MARKGAPGLQPQIPDSQVGLSVTARHVQVAAPRHSAVPDPANRAGVHPQKPESQVGVSMDRPQSQVVAVWHAAHSTVGIQYTASVRSHAYQA